MKALKLVSTDLIGHPTEPPQPPQLIKRRQVTQDSFSLDRSISEKITSVQ